jgi:hypothetical protein
MVTIKIFVEGGGDQKPLKIACRKGFSEFLKKAGVVNQPPRILPCGGRDNAFKEYKKALKNGEAAILLVDSEAPIEPRDQQGKNLRQWLPWSHLAERDNWDKPSASNDVDCHLMVQCMESWLIADQDALSGYFRNFDTKKLPKNKSVEDIGKVDLYRSMDAAIRAADRKKSYSKGKHSFGILGEIDAAKIMVASPWAKRFVEEVISRTSNDLRR